MNRFLFFIFLFLSIGCDSINKKNGENTVNKLEIRDNTPIFLEGNKYDRQNGTIFSFDEVKGKVLLLDFWNTNCAPCIRQHPMVVKLKKKINNPNFKVITVSIDNDREKWYNFVKKNNWEEINIHIGYKPKDTLFKILSPKPYIYNKKGKQVELYPASIPAYYLIDKNLNIYKIDSLESKKIVNQINNLLK